MTAETYSDIGKTLRESREALGLDLYTVAENIRVRAKYLAAIEDGNLADLPGKAYIKAYILSYADYLRLDRKLVSAAIDALDSAKQTTRIQFAAPTSIKNSPSREVLMASVGLAFMVYAYAYFALREAPAPDAFTVSDIPPEYQAILDKDKKDGKKPDAAKTASGKTGEANPCLSPLRTAAPVGCKENVLPDEKPVTTESPISVMDVSGSKKNYLKPLGR